MCADGLTNSSVAKRTGEANAVNQKLEVVWRHANITRKRKIEIFDSCIISKLLYSLEVQCLRKADMDRQDAFQARCLRRICRIPHSMISHVSNAEVTRISGQEPLSNTMLYRQLSLYGKIANRPNDDSLREASLCNCSCLPKQPLKRCRGRPRMRWATVMHAHALQL